MEVKVYNLISKQLGINKKKLSLETNLFTDLDVNSYDLVSLICVFEESFDIEISEAQIREIRTIADIVNYIKG